MIVYHGTTVSRLDAIASSGLLPDQPQYRTDGTGRSGFVYLSRYYSPGYALLGADVEGVTEGLVIEVEMDTLDQTLFRPDEDDLAYQKRGRGASPEEIEEERARINLEEHISEWRAMFEAFGNVAYKSPIASKNLRRYARILLMAGESQTPFADFILEYGISSLPRDGQIPSDVEQYGQLLRAFHGIVFDGSIPAELNPHAPDQYGMLMMAAQRAGGVVPEALQFLLDARSEFVHVESFAPPKHSEQP